MQPTRMLIAAVSVAATVEVAQADLLDLQLQNFPDIASGFIDVTYNSMTNTLTASGFALLFDDDGSVPPENILNGSFSIVATINEMGQPMGGTLTVGGNVLGFGPSLLTGTLTAFGFQSGGGPLFEFLFTVTGGDLAAPYFGKSVGVKLSGVNFGGSFLVDFNNLINGMPGTGTAVADIASPLPAPAALALLAMWGLGSRRRRRVA